MGLRFDVEKLVDRLEKTYNNFNVRFVAGRRNLNEYYEAFSRCNYQVAVADYDDGRRALFVDTAITNEIQGVLLTSPCPGYIVILTGDGNDNSGRRSFYDCITSALELGWVVHHFCWSHSRNHRYNKLQRIYGALYRLEFLDDFYGDFVHEKSDF